jgi:glycosyltransferase involved in cell wall biosynthesis
MRVQGLIAHEWIEPHGGAEKVLDAMVEAYPDADISCLWSDAPGRYPNRRVIESFLARTPLRRRKALALPLMSHHWRRHATDGYDWALVSSHAFAHHLGSDRGRRERPTFVYAHTPARYLWNPDLDDRGNSFAARAGGAMLRRIDRRHAGGALYAANSVFVRDRIRTAWDVDAIVLHPPVDVERLQRHADWREELTEAEIRHVEGLPATYVMGASRFVPYKALDQVIAFGEAVNVPVVLAGAGPDEGRLRSVAATCRVPVIFVDRPRDALLYTLIQQATAFVFPPVEDFGILPVEAVALGTPVIVNQRGGAAESLAVTKGGVAHDFSDIRLADSALSQALRADMQHAAAAACNFTVRRFQSRLVEWMAIQGSGAFDASHAPRALAEK